MGAVPPETFEVIEPFERPKQVTSLTVLESKLGPPAFCMVELDSDVHPLLSVTSIEYVPDDRLLNELVAWNVDPLLIE
jgi:hypothetical protein